MLKAKPGISGAILSAGSFQEAVRAGEIFEIAAGTSLKTQKSP
jgi:hypothetical protein